MTLRMSLLLYVVCIACILLPRLHHEVINVQCARKHCFYKMWSKIEKPGVSITKGLASLHVSDPLPLNVDLGITLF